MSKVWADWLSKYLMFQLNKNKQMSSLLLSRPIDFIIFIFFVFNLNFILQEVMSVEEETTSCYCLLDPYACHILLNSFGTYALIGEPISDCAVRQLKVAVFGCLSCNSLDYNLRVYCMDNTPCAFQVNFVNLVVVTFP